MNSTFDDLSPQLQDHCEDVARIVMSLMPFHEKREETYALSFAKRGESGVWMNLMRKTDRLDRLANKVFSGEEVGNAGVTLVDTLVDTAMYALKWLAVIQQVRPGDMERWIAEVYAKEVGMDVEDALVLFGVVDEQPPSEDIALANWLDRQIKHWELQGDVGNVARIQKALENSVKLEEEEL